MLLLITYNNKKIEDLLKQLTVEEKDGVLIISDSYVNDKKYAGNDTIQKVVSKIPKYEDN